MDVIVVVVDPVVRSELSCRSSEIIDRFWHQNEVTASRGEYGFVCNRPDVDLSYAENYRDAPKLGRAENVDWVVVVVRDDVVVGDVVVVVEAECKLGERGA